MKLEILNSGELGTWIWKHRDNMLMSIKGDAPIGARYSDGELITQKVNVAWQDSVTGEVFRIKYKGCL